ncbi:MAG: hypothetical protein PWQ51_2117 [Methanolobus sp.]|jgi:geranylgeranyl reductase family protein|nr:hypothetical protein [Methanolobus sp.]
MIYDIIVVGGGPSGSLAAKTCAENGLSVLLLEKEKVPRYKACGGAVSKKALELIGPLNELDEKYESYGAVAFSPSLVSVIGKTEDITSVLTFRKDLDYLLLKRAEKSGVEVLTGKKVESVLVNEDSVLVKTADKDYSGKIIIGADGVNSLIAKETGIRKKWEKGGSGICIEVEVELPSEIIEKLIVDEKLIEVYFLKENGYGWIFPKGKIMSIGIGLWKPLNKKPSKVFDEFISTLEAKSGVEFNQYIGQRYAHMIPLGGPSRNNSKERVMLVGDAAGFVDSFTGEGIYFAIKSGIIAGEIAGEAIKENNFSKNLFAKYNQKCKKEINDNLNTALKFSNYVYPNIEQIVKLMAADPYLFEKYVLVGRGDMTYKKYVSMALTRLPVSIIRKVIRH